VELGSRFQCDFVPGYVQMAALMHGKPRLWADETTVSFGNSGMRKPNAVFYQRQAYMMSNADRSRLESVKFSNEIAQA